MLVHVAQPSEYKYAAHDTEQLASWHSISSTMQCWHGNEYSVMEEHLLEVHAAPADLDWISSYPHSPWQAPI